MFQRIITGDSQVLCTVAAFAVAAAIFAAVAWRAFRMNSSQSKQMASLPFATRTPASHDEHSEELDLS